MSTAAHVHTAILLPGLKMPDAQLPHEIDDFGMKMDSETDGFAWLENEAKRIYSVDRDKIITTEEVAVDVDKRLAETLFCFCEMIEVGDFAGDAHPWLEDWMSESGFEELEEGNMKAMYDVARPILDATCAVDPEPKSWIGEEKPKRIDYRGRTIHEVQFLGIFQEHTSTDYFVGYPEIDEIEFCGPAKCVLIQEAK